MHISKLYRDKQNQRLLREKLLLEKGAPPLRQFHKNHLGSSGQDLPRNQTFFEISRFPSPDPMELAVITALLLSLAKK